MTRPVLVLVACLLSNLAAVAQTTAPAPKPPSRSYALLRFDENWSWVGVQEAPVEDAFDVLKNRSLGGEWRFTAGGSSRLRFEWDDNRTLGASPWDEDQVWRFRALAYFSFQHAKHFRWFVEAKYTDSWGTDRPVGPTWTGDPDLENFFLEGTAASETPHPVTFRFGRQELLFGKQRLVGPLDWASERRTFDGGSIISRTPRTTTQLFGVRPLTREVHSVDSATDGVMFWGLHESFKPAAGHVLEGYVLVLDDARDVFVSESGGEKGDVFKSTWGVRYQFEKNGWLGETELDWQTGNWTDDDFEAYSVTATGGYQWGKAAWKPKLHGGFDVASGDEDPSDGTKETFDQLFPTGHLWFGHADLVGRRNIRSVRAGLDLEPRKGLRWETSFHRFWLDQAEDALYDASGAAIRRDPTGAAGRDVGWEVDTWLGYTFKQHHQVALEICWFQAGEFIEETGDGDDVLFAWIGYELRF